MKAGSPNPGANPLSGQFILNTDGGMAPGQGHRKSQDPRGRAVIGVLLRTRHLATVDTISKEIGPATHNEAEYQALIRGLQLTLDHGVQRIRVYMDSELVVDQMNGDSAVKEPRLAELHSTASSLCTQFKSIRVSWVPREWNAEADQLARDALGGAR